VGPSEVTNIFYLLNIFVCSIGAPINGLPLSNVGLNFLKEDPLEVGSYHRVCKFGDVDGFTLGCSKSSMVAKSPATDAVAID
jgi:hypothetical protein